jgi:UDP-N-acetylglucosamine 2-epimerase
MDELKEIKTTALIVGTRPNFMKAAPLWKELKKKQRSNLYLVHTGQHYSQSLSGIFLKQMGISSEQEIVMLAGYPRTATPEESFAWMLTELTKWFRENAIEKVIVFGDVNSSLVGALAASFLHLQIVHVEAGLRSFNMLMPEERNRILVDHLSHLMLTTELSAQRNLLREGIVGRSEMCGNTMMDTLVSLLPVIEKLITYKKFRVEKKKYILFTFHRQENVDSPEILRKVISVLDKLSKKLKIMILIPLHPRTKKAMERFGIKPFYIKIIEPQGYIQMMNLVLNCGILLTDSGGLQEEAAYLGVPTITLRRETERPITVEKGWNKILSPSDKNFPQAIHEDILLRIGKRKSDLTSIRKEMGEGRAAQLMVKKILAL